MMLTSKLFLIAIILSPIVGSANKTSGSNSNNQSPPANEENPPNEPDDSDDTALDTNKENDDSLKRISNDSKLEKELSILRTKLGINDRNDQRFQDDDELATPSLDDIFSRDLDDSRPAPPLPIIQSAPVRTVSGDNVKNVFNEKPTGNFARGNNFYPLPIIQTAPVHTWSDLGNEKKPSSESGLSGNDITKQDVLDFVEYLKRIKENMEKKAQGDDEDASVVGLSSSEEDPFANDDDDDSGSFEESPSIYNEKTVKVTVEKSEKSEMYGLPPGMTIDELYKLAKTQGDAKEDANQAVNLNGLVSLLVPKNGETEQQVHITPWQDHQTENSKSAAGPPLAHRPPPPPPPHIDDDAIHRGLTFGVHISPFTLLTLAIAVLVGYFAYLMCKYGSRAIAGGHEQKQQNVFATTPIAPPVPMKVEEMK